MAGVDLLHIPYKGGQPAIADLLAGQVSIYIPVRERRPQTHRQEVQRFGQYRRRSEQFPFANFIEEMTGALVYPSW